jgi:LysM repeat protein
VLKEELALQSGKSKKKNVPATIVLSIVGVLFIVMIAKAYFMKNDILVNEENVAPSEKIESQPEVKDEPVDTKAKETDTITEKETEKKPAAAKPAYTTYTVQDGDTLGEIANANGMSSSQLMKYNGITDPEAIKAGQNIKIPN